MADRKGDPTKQPAECQRSKTRDCPHLKETGGGFDGERYDCKVCGEHYYLDYDDMR